MRLFTSSVICILAQRFCSGVFVSFHLFLFFYHIYLLSMCHKLVMLILGILFLSFGEVGVTDQEESALQMRTKYQLLF